VAKEATLTSHIHMHTYVLYVYLMCVHIHARTSGSSSSSATLSWVKSDPVSIIYLGSIMLQSVDLPLFACTDPKHGACPARGAEKPMATRIARAGPGDVWGFDFDKTAAKVFRLFRALMHRPVTYMQFADRDMADLWDLGCSLALSACISREVWLE
jgi:hypothetical protein